MVFRAYRYRIYPNKTQQDYLNQNFGAVRFLWNQLVANFNSYSKCGPNRKISEKTLKDMEEYSWLNSCISYALQQKRIDFEETKSQYFSKTRKVKLERMKFKKKGISQDSFRIPGQKLNYNKCIDFGSRRIKLPKMQPIKIIIDREFSGNVRSVTVSKNKVNQYFVSVLVEENVIPKQITDSSVGIDLGLAHFIVLSNGIKIDNPRWFRKSQSKLKASQQHLSRKNHDSNRYKKQKLKVANIHNKIRNKRNWFHHNLSTAIVENFNHIIMENLNISGMKKSNLGKSISDAGWGEFSSMIEYKCNWYGRSFHKIDRFYPSSKNCSRCGYKFESMKLSIRKWKCPSCDTVHDRDINAAKNILDRGLKDLYSFTSDELTDYRHREGIRLANSEVSLDEVFSKFYKTL